MDLEPEARFYPEAQAATELSTKAKLEDQNLPLTILSLVEACQARSVVFSKYLRRNVDSPCLSKIPNVSFVEIV